MPYTPTTWTDEVPASTPIKYVITDDVDGVIASSATIALVTSVTAGTPINATNLNRMEAAIEDAVTASEAAVPKSIFTAIGDLIYATASSTVTRLAKPSIDSVLKMTNGGAPSWKSLGEMLLVSKRQGGSSTHWGTNGTTNYTPTAQKIQVGATATFNINTTASIGYSGSYNVTFPESFTYYPIVFLSNQIYLPTIAGPITLSYVSGGTTGFTIYATCTHIVNNLIVSWIAIGE